MSELIILDAEEPRLRFFLSEVYSSITERQPPFTVQTSSFRQLTLRISRFFTSADVLIELPPILCLGAVVDAVVIFTGITSARTRAENNNRPLAKGISPAVFHRLFPALRRARRSQELSNEQEASHL